MLDRKMFLTHLGSINGKADGNRINLSEDDKGLYTPEAIRASNKTGKSMVLGKDGKLYELGADPTRALPGSALYNQSAARTTNTTSGTQTGPRYLPSAPPTVYPDELYQEPTPHKMSKYVKIGDGPMAYWKRRVDVHPHGDNYGHYEYRPPSRPMGGDSSIGYVVMNNPFSPEGYSSFRNYDDAQRGYKEIMKQWNDDMIRRTRNASRQQDIDVNRDIEREMRDADEPTIGVKRTMVDTWIQPEDGLGGPIKVKVPYAYTMQPEDKVRMRTNMLDPELQRLYRSQFEFDHPDDTPVAHNKRVDDEIRRMQEPNIDIRQPPILPSFGDSPDPRELFPDEFTGPFERPHSGGGAWWGEPKPKVNPSLNKMSSSANRRNSGFWA